MYFDELDENITAIGEIITEYAERLDMARTEEEYFNILIDLFFIGYEVGKNDTLLAIIEDLEDQLEDEL